MAGRLCSGRRLRHRRTTRCRGHAEGTGRSADRRQPSGGFRKSRGGRAGAGAGGLRALAVYAPQRLASLPSVPTFSELGFGSVSAFILHGVVGPGGMPRPVVERLNAALHVAMRSPKVIAMFAENGLRAEPGTPEDFENLVRLERARVGSIIRSAGIKAE